MNMHRKWIGLWVVCALANASAHARTVYRCVRGNTVSLATAPEPGSRCEAKHVDDDVARVPNLWGSLGNINGTLYEKNINGRMVYSTRRMPGWTPVLKFFVATPPGSPAHEGLGRVSTPQVNVFAAEFKAAARSSRVDEAFLRAIAHAESGFNPQATSPKGAQGVMQLMPSTARELGVANAYAQAEAIQAGARLLKRLLGMYGGNYARAAAAYNAGPGAVARYGGVPPYRETQAYVQKVTALHAAYRQAMKLPSLRAAQTLRAAQ